ncbi:MAG TPA: UPF0149 family protein [Dokdonella sp.]
MATTSFNLGHAELARALRALRLGVDASDLHGSLTGYLCCGGEAGPDDWLDALQYEVDAPAAGDATLRRLYRVCAAQFAGVQVWVDPLLPSGGVPLQQRAEAFVEWCRGFLGGCGLAGAHAAGWSSQAEEILADFALIAATPFECSRPDEDARALADLVDFVRTGAALLHREARLQVPRRRLH